MRGNVGGDTDDFIRMVAVGSHGNDAGPVRLVKQTVHSFPSLPSPAGVADLKNDGQARRGGRGHGGFGFARLGKRLQEQRIGFGESKALSPIDLLQRRVRIILQAKPQAQRPDRSPDQAFRTACLPRQRHARAVDVVAPIGCARLAQNQSVCRKRVGHQNL